MSNEPYRQIGQNIKNIRRRAGLTQHDLGELLGVTFQQVQKYEAGTNRIPAFYLFTLKHALGIPLGLFFDRVQMPGAPAPDLRRVLVERIYKIRDRHTLARLHRVTEALLGEE
ncbi:MAG TPA: helix-turn-helix transcriptional regulator [Alphaproteobacteria bacterium]|nr:helix-turn-helix transcriptional regulator [Alphaproteobacteria bacterium]